VKPREARAALLACCTALWPLSGAHARQQRLSYGEVRVSGAEAAVRLRFALGDLGGVVTFPWGDPPAPGEVEQMGPQVAQALLSQLPGALLAFNLGVEAGQLSLVLLELPLLAMLRRRGIFGRREAAAVSAAILAAGGYWLAGRF
jgi:hypothetical protein